MSRCIRKVENEDWYIVYCNTSDILFPFRFDSVKTADYFINIQNTNHDLFWKIYNRLPKDMIINILDIKEIELGDK